MKTAFAYLRVSGNSQLDGDGFDRQHFAVAQFAAAKGYDSVTYFREEAVPGKTEMTDRPAFLEMVAGALAASVQTIIVEALDRLAREYRVQEMLLTYLASKQIDLIAANTGENVTEALMGDPMRRALVQIQGILAELDKNLIVSKLYKARKRARDRGERCEGQPPFGYKTVKEKGQPVRLEQVEHEQFIIQRVKAMRANNWSIPDITIEMNEAGWKPRRGKRWHPMSVKRILERPSLPNQISKS